MQLPPSLPGSFTLDTHSVLSSDEESSNNSTPTTSTPFSLTYPHDHFHEANNITGNNTTLPPLEDTMPANPFIRDLIAEGVRYIKYDSLKTIRELGSVSCVCMCPKDIHD